MIVDRLPCRILVEQATDWLEGELPTGDCKEVELHLVTCAGCLAYVEQLRRTRQAVAQAVTRADQGADPPPAEVRSRLLAMFRRRATQGG